MGIDRRNVITVSHLMVELSLFPIMDESIPLVLFMTSRYMDAISMAC